MPKTVWFASQVFKIKIVLFCSAQPWLVGVGEICHTFVLISLWFFSASGFNNFISQEIVLISHKNFFLSSGLNDFMLQEIVYISRSNSFWYRGLIISSHRNFSNFSPHKNCFNFSQDFVLTLDLKILSHRKLFKFITGNELFQTRKLSLAWN